MSRKVCDHSMGSRLVLEGEWLVERCKGCDAEMGREWQG